jgi:serine phosphatase RsbU (regulator of sigma subunit)
MFSIAAATKRSQSTWAAQALASAGRVRHAACLAGTTLAYEQRGTDSGCDVVQVYQASESRLVFALIDVAGDRSSGGALAQAAAAAFETGAAELFAGSDVNESEALSNLAMRINRSLMAVGVRFAAAFLACYDARTGALWYVNAGHTPALIHADGAQELGASGVPFGLFSHAIHDAQVTVLQPGAAFLLISKGVVEMGARRREFGLGGAKQVIASEREPADVLCAAVLDAAERFAEGRSPRQHDRTALALVRH